MEKIKIGNRLHGEKGTGNLAGLHKGGNLNYFIKEGPGGKACLWEDANGILLTISFLELKECFAKKGEEWTSNLFDTLISGGFRKREMADMIDSLCLGAEYRTPQNQIIFNK